MLQQKEAEKEKDAKAAQRPSVTVAAEIHPQPPRKPSEGRKQEKPGQLLAAGGRFSMTVGENLNLKVGVQVLLQEEILALAKSLASDVTCTFWENYNKRFRHKFQSSQCIKSSQMGRQDDEKQKGKQDEKRILKVLKKVIERVVYECLESGNSPFDFDEFMGSMLGKAKEIYKPKKPKKK